ncbi:MAG: ATP-binding protein [Flavisolibacter sp.]
MQTNAPELIRSFPFLAGGGETGEMIRSIDWSATPLGSPDQWPQSLRTCVRIVLTSRQPMFVWWGKELINIYNDAYIDIVRGKHPGAMGKPANMVWKEIWDQVGPRADTVMQKNEGTYDEALLLIMERNGYPEETYYTFSYSPVPGDDGGTAGIICANTDDTDRILGERQLRTLKDLGKGIIDCKSNEEVFRKSIEVLKNNPQDFPFAFIYELDQEGKKVRLVNFAGSQQIPSEIPTEIDIANQLDIYPSFAAAVQTNKPQLVNGLRKRFKSLPSGGWPVPPDRALVLPIIQTGQKNPYAFLNIGLNPYRVLDEKYSSFFQLIADQLATAISTVHAYEEERRRAEALAEIDRAKTAFFSNISHEFRTPLTLMLSPLQELKRQEEELPEEARKNIDVSYRNTLRLQKLVNTLLDFSRIEAGRMHARYEETDLSQLTIDLVSSFRSAIEKAGMELIVDCPALSHTVYVDVDMWEKIVLNLMSNAFKYTRTGNITVKLKQQQNSVELSITDTGVGIPDDQVEKIFERFHRVQNTSGRSQEGTGIGLALVQELVRLHHGSIGVKTKLGSGSVFTVTIPTGREHLPDENIISDSSVRTMETRPEAFIGEVMKWLPEEKKKENTGGVSQKLKRTNKDLVLLADDNADMRDYVKRLLSTNYDIITVENGRLALQQAREQIPDLIVSDVMMPEMDGFELVKRLKSDSFTARIPIILLSARAGEEATIEGLNSGAEDYLVKPFSVRELLTRIDSNIRIARLQNYAALQIHHVFMQAPVAISILRGPNLVIELANEAILKIWGKTNEIVGKPLLEGIPEIQNTAYPKMLQEVMEKGVTHHASEHSTELIRNDIAEQVYFNFVYQPLVEIDGSISGVLAAANEITDQVEARKIVEDAEQRLRLAAEGTGLATWDLNLLNSQIIYSPRLNEIFGRPRSARMQHRDMRLQIHPDDIHTIVEEAYEVAMKTGVYFYEARVVWPDATVKWLRTHGKVVYNEEAVPVRMLGTMMDITREKEAEIHLKESEERYRNLATELDLRVKSRTEDLSEANERLERSNKELEQFAFITSHDLQEPLRKIQTFGHMLHDSYGKGLDVKGKNYLDKMLSASKRMSKLINDLLNFSRLRQSGEGLVRVDLNEVLENIKNDFELVIQQKRAIIEQSDLPCIEANPLQMNQLLYNLLSNALKFTAQGRKPLIHINCQIVDKEKGQQLNLPDHKTYYELTFSDNGIGFAQEYSKKIFQIFQRLNAQTEYEGTGIGLALVNKIIENHKGLVFARSKEGNGSSFHIILPESQ